MQKKGKGKGPGQGPGQWFTPGRLWANPVSDYPLLDLESSEWEPPVTVYEPIRDPNGREKELIIRF